MPWGGGGVLIRILFMNSLLSAIYSFHLTSPPAKLTLTLTLTSPPANLTLTLTLTSPSRIGDDMHAQFKELDHVAEHMAGTSVFVAPLQQGRRGSKEP